ncbi:MAG: 4Fe-4S binding protein [Lachnospiraceae bacterium]|nr:4Fe-4S binding protein [Lachnospiraceae bacterium]
MGNMQSVSGSGEPQVAFVACSGSAAGVARFAGKCATCAEAVESGFERGECKNGCVGVGSCVSACKYGALKLENGKIVVDREKCNGCGECAAEGVCPQHLIRMIPADATNFIPCSNTEDDEEVVRNTCGYGCIACGECERVCPQGAVSIVDNHAVIDYSKCVGCSACTVRCKKKIIVDTLHDLTVIKDKVAFVRCSGGNRASEKFTSMGLTDCKEAAKLDAKELNLCTTGCCGLGSCTAVCRYGAISVVNGTAVVDPDKCVGCRDCTFACPRHLITMVPYKGTKLVPCSSVDDYEDKSKVCDSGCIACEDCYNNCPNGAIYMEGKHAVIDPVVCEDCNMCQYVCSHNIIKAQEVPEHIYKQRKAMELEEGGYWL